MSDYLTRCDECGVRMPGGNFTADIRLCRRHRANWIVDSIRDWSDLFGEPPSAFDWSLGDAIRNYPPDRISLIEYRHQFRTWPTKNQAHDIFGKWNNAISAAGFTPRSARSKVLA